MKKNQKEPNKFSEFLDNIKRDPRILRNLILSIVGIVVLIFYLIFQFQVLRNQALENTKVKLIETNEIIKFIVQNTYDGMNQDFDKHYQVVTTEFNDQYQIDYSGEVPLVKTSDDVIMNWNIDQFKKLRKLSGAHIILLVKTDSAYYPFSPTLSSSTDEEKMNQFSIPYSHPKYPQLLENQPIVINKKILDKNFFVYYRPLSFEKNQLDLLVGIAIDFNQKVEYIRQEIQSLKISEGQSFFICDFDENANMDQLLISYDSKSKKKFEALRKEKKYNMLLIPEEGKYIQFDHIHGYLYLFPGLNWMIGSFSEVEMISTSALLIFMTVIGILLILGITGYWIKKLDLFY